MALQTEAEIVNVASVPQRSPFRYPGGKTWLVPLIRRWLRSLAPRPRILFEPFAGGGIVGLTAAFEGLTDHVVFVELDKQVAAVWETILGGDAAWLADRILAFKMTPDNARRVLAAPTEETREKAFQTIIKNRAFYGGILAPGAAFVRRGENGKGLMQRWYPETLARRIRAIGHIRRRFTFICGDGMSVLQRQAKTKRAAFFLDPPYTADATSKRAGCRLYTHHAIDHERLFKTASSVAGDVLLTYEDCSAVRQLALGHALIVDNVRMKNSHHAHMAELVISRHGLQK